MRKVFYHGKHRLESGRPSPIDIQDRISTVATTPVRHDKAGTSARIWHKNQQALNAEKRGEASQVFTKWQVAAQTIGLVFTSCEVQAGSVEGRFFFNRAGSPEPSVNHINQSIKGIDFGEAHVQAVEQDGITWIDYCGKVIPGFPRAVEAIGNLALRNE